MKKLNKKKIYKIKVNRFRIMAKPIIKSSEINIITPITKNKPNKC